MDTNEPDELRTICPVCGMILYSTDVNDIPHPIHTDHATAHESHEWMAVVESLTIQRDEVIRMHNEKADFINEIVGVLTLAQHEIWVIQQSCKGSIGSLTNVYLPQMDAARVDKVSARINEILERVKGCAEDEQSH